MIQPPITEPGSLSKLWTWLRAVGLQLFVAEFVSFFCGWLPEVKFSSNFTNTGWEPYSPAITCAALALGFYLSPVVLKTKGAASTWMIGVLWLCYGFFETAKGWSPASSDQPTRWAYAATNLFGKTDQCSGSDCMGELFFTTPCSVAVAYSIGAIAYRCWQRVAHKPKG